MRIAFGAIAASVAVLMVVACGSSDDGAATPDGGVTPGSEGGGPGSEGGGPGAEGGVGHDGSTGDDGSTSLDGGTDGEVAVDAGPPAIQLIGRFDQSVAGSAKAAWPGARIIANFLGTEVKVTLSDTALFNPSYGSDRWQVFIDGVADATPLQLDHTAGPQTFTLATGLANAPHRVELTKITEASVGATTFQGFDFSGGTLLPPPLLKTRHLQFLGDSASNGYGIEGTAPCDFTAATENELFSYPALIGNALDADHHNLGASGKGIYQDYTRGDSDTFPVIYQYDGVNTFPHTIWDSTAYTPDVVWITLGGNDYSDVGNGVDEPTQAQFQGKYLTLVTTIRTQYPDAHIICSVAPSLTDAFPAGFNAYTNVKTAVNAVVSTRAGAGDAKIYAFEFTRSATNGTDTTACGGHPNKAKHVSMATEATAFIKTKTGW